MIKNMKPLSLVEAREIAKARENKDTEAFIKKFSKMNEKEALKLKEELEQLSILKLKPESIAKIMDILPEDNTDLNKILVDISLTEDESNKILEIVKKYI